MLTKQQAKQLIYNIAAYLLYPARMSELSTDTTPPTQGRLTLLLETKRLV